MAELAAGNAPEKPGDGEAASWEGGHYVPQVGLAAVAEFQGRWPLLVDVASESVRKLFDMKDDVLGDLRANINGCVVCAVSDPGAKDCPLVFLSRGFEEMTGYKRDFGLGRNCRFLQPNTPGLNKIINGDEVQKMRSFCHLNGGEEKGRSIVNLLLNERRTGERFWNLLHMQFVTVEDKPYILGIQTILNLPMPTVLRCATVSAAVQTYDEAQFSCFTDELRSFLSQLRPHLNGEATANMRKAEESVTKSIVAFMKSASSDYEGDHWVPVVGMDKAIMFQQDVKWSGVFEQVQNSLYKVWEVSESSEEVVACAVSDPSGEDCPLVYISREFEKVTGYQREWVLGRNCRFLQPNNRWRNLAFNGEDCAQMREFCTEAQPRGTRIVNMLVNEHKNGYPFWNLLVMEHIEVTTMSRSVSTVGPRVAEKRPYIFGVQTALDIEVFKLAELLAKDIDGLAQLSRLRRILRAREAELSTRSLHAFARDCLAEWISDLPVLFQVPRLQFRRPPAGRKAVSVPLVGLEIGTQSMFELVPGALEEGLRHFYLSFSEEDRSMADVPMIELQAKLMALKLAELLTFLQRRFFHYLRAGISFTLLTPPLFVDSVGEILKSLRSHGYHLDCWMLDLRCGEARCAVQASRAMHCWEAMSQSFRFGDARGLGVCGGGRELFEKIHRIAEPTAPFAVWAMELFPGKTFSDHKDVSFYEQLRTSDVAVVAYNLFGPNDCVLASLRLRKEAQLLCADPVLMLMKWAEVQGYGIMVPKLRSNGRLGSGAPASDDPKGPEAGGLVQSTQGHEADIHRSFIRDFSKTPTAISLFQAIQSEAEVGPTRDSVSFQKRRLSLSDVRDRRAGGRRQTYGQEFAGVQREAVGASDPPLSPGAGAGLRVCGTFASAGSGVEPHPPPLPATPRHQRRSTSSDPLSEQGRLQLRSDLPVAALPADIPELGPFKPGTLPPLQPRQRPSNKADQASGAGSPSRGSSSSTTETLQGFVPAPPISPKAPTAAQPTSRFVRPQYLHSTSQEAKGHRRPRGKVPIFEASGPDVATNRSASKAIRDLHKAVCGDMAGHLGDEAFAAGTESAATRAASSTATSITTLGSHILDGDPEPPGLQRRLVAKLATKGFSTEEIAETLELDHGAVEALLQEGR